MYGRHRIVTSLLAKVVPVLECWGQAACRASFSVCGIQQASAQPEPFSLQNSLLRHLSVMSVQNDVTSFGNRGSAAEAHTERPVLPDNRKYAVLGTGAVGGFYGTCLQLGGADVHFLLNSEYSHVARHGLIVESTLKGDMSLPKVNAYQGVQQMPKCDVVLVCWKALANHLLPSVLPHVLAPDGVVVFIQNGLGVEQEYAPVIGAQSIIGCTSYILASRVGPGRIKHMGRGEVVLGEYDERYAPGGISERMRQISKDFERGGIPAALDPDLFVARWRKLVWNIPFSGMSVALQEHTDAMVTDPDMQALCRALMQEVIQGLDASIRHLTPELAGSRGLPAELVDAMVTMTAANKVPYKTSMLLDYEAGKPLELDAIYCGVLRCAREAGVELPRIQALYQQLAFLDRRNVARKAAQQAA